MVTQNVVLISLAMAGFAVLHSLTAGSGVKRFVQVLFGERLAEGWYRLGYNLFSVMSIGPALYLAIVLPDRVLYTVTSPYLYLLLIIQAAGALGALWGLLSVDLLRFVGLRQALAHLAGEPLPLAEEPLQQGGIYSIVRHPLYLFGLLVLWPVPVMTQNLLVLNTGATLYLVAGSLIEERRLLGIYGEEYRRYRQRVRWLIPWPYSKSRQDGLRGEGGNVIE